MTQAKTAEEWQQEIDQHREEHLQWVSNIGAWMVKSDRMLERMDARMNQFQDFMEAYIERTDARMEKIEGHLGKIVDTLEAIELRLPPPNGAGGLKMG